MTAALRYQHPTSSPAPTASLKRSRGAEYELLETVKESFTFRSIAVHKVLHRALVRPPYKRFANNELLELMDARFMRVGLLGDKVLKLALECAAREPTAVQLFLRSVKLLIPQHTAHIMSGVCLPPGSRSVSSTNVRRCCNIAWPPTVKCW